MHRIVAILGSLIFQLFFTLMFVGGVIGTIFGIREWSNAPSGEVGILPAMLLLTVGLAVVGGIGIVRFRSAAERGFQVSEGASPLVMDKPIANTVWGAAAFLLGVGYVAYQLQSPPDPRDRLIEVPVVLICAGLAQCGIGLWYLARGRRKAGTLPA